MRIGPYLIDPPLVLAPMAGVTDKPFRLLCRRLGAGLAVSEMTAADPRLWRTRKSQQRMDHEGEAEPVSVQIAGADPGMLAEAARYNAEGGAQIIDINMGCPAKKVCHQWAGSALLQNESLVGRICKAVVDAVDLPVTLKFRTGWDRQHKNALRVARIAEDAGIAALALHGRTRADRYQGEAEYETIGALKAVTSIPLMANGDITTPERARQVLGMTAADALMIGRGAQGRPWIFRELAHYLATGRKLPDPTPTEVAAILLEHLEQLYAFYGEDVGMRIARKHLAWYARDRAENAGFRQIVNRADTAQEQWRLTRNYFDALAAGLSRAA